MRQPRSSAFACPLFDHHEYGPSMSPASSRMWSWYPAARRSVTHCLSCGRKPDFLLFALG